MTLIKPTTPEAYRRKWDCDFVSLWFGYMEQNLYFALITYVELQIVDKQKIFFSSIVFPLQGNKAYTSPALIHELHSLQCDLLI